MGGGRGHGLRSEKRMVSREAQVRKVEAEVRSVGGGGNRGRGRGGAVPGGRDA